MKYKLITAFILGLFLISCIAPQKRIQRITKRNPWLIKTDSIKVTDTFNVILPGVKKDSLIYVEDLKKDTVYIVKEQLRIKTFIHNDTLFVHGECDTIIKEIVREVSVAYEQLPYHKPRDKLMWDLLPYILIIIISVCVIIGVVLIIRLFRS